METKGALPASVPPPGAAAAPAPAPPGSIGDERAGDRWLKQNVAFQVIGATVWGSMLAAWFALGASFSAALAGAAAICIAVPLLGWFVGLPMVLATGFAAAAVWFCGVLAIFAGWGISMAAVAIATTIRAHLNSRTS